MLLFDLSHCCSSICSLCHQFSYRHRVPCPCTRERVSVPAGTRAPRSWQGNRDEHSVLNALASAGRELAVFWGGNPECHSLNCHDDACGRLGVKAAFCIQNGAGFPVPRQLWPRHMAGSGPSNLGVPLRASGNIDVGFYYTCWGVVAGSAHVTICLCFWLEASVSEWMACTVHLTKYCVSTHHLWRMIILCFVVLIRLWKLFKDVTAELITFCMYF